MSLETYIFKTNIEEAEKKAYEIVKTRNRACLKYFFTMY